MALFPKEHGAYGQITVAAAPGLLIAAAIAAHPPAPTHLRALGWTLVAVSVVTAAIVVAIAY